MTDTAVKLWIRDIVDGTFEPSETGYGGVVALPDGNKFSRVRILGTVVDKFISDSRSFASATIDDSTETVQIKLFKDQVQKIESLAIGDIIDILGDINEYQGEVYVLPRAMQKVDINWEMLRRIELNVKKSAVSSQQSDNAVEKQIETLEAVILDKLTSLDKGKGVKIEDLVNDLKDQDENLVLSAVRNIMHKGDVFEPKKGVLKLV